MYMFYVHCARGAVFLYTLFCLRCSDVVSRCALRVFRSALCALRILELDTLRFSGEKGKEVVKFIIYMNIFCIFYFNVDFLSDDFTILEKI